MDGVVQNVVINCLEGCGKSVAVGVALTFRGAVGVLTFTLLGSILFGSGVAARVIAVVTPVFSKKINNLVVIVIGKTCVLVRVGALGEVSKLVTVKGEVVIVSIIDVMLAGINQIGK